MLTATHDPCHLVWQVKQIDQLENPPRRRSDPCRLARQVKKISQLRSPTALQYLRCRTTWLKRLYSARPEMREMRARQEAVVQFYDRTAFLDE
jgi:hypothetical protein